MSTFLLLVRHFFGRFFDNEIVTQGGDMRTNVAQALGLVAVPGMFVAMYMLPQRVRYDAPFARNWILISDYYFFVVFSMVVMGFVMIFQWDALFPDRKDYLILTPLPIGGLTVFASKTIALILFMALFVIDTNLFATMLAPMISAPAGTPPGIAVELVLVHVTAVGAAGISVALAFAALQGLLINVLTGRAFRRISPWIRMAGMALLIVVLFVTPMVWAGLRPLFEQNSPVLRWFPPFWFLALYVDMLPGRPGGPVFAETATLARTAIAVVAALFAATYLAGYVRHTRRVLESSETAGTGPGRLRSAIDRFVNRWLLPDPLERATFHFISNTVLRTEKQRLFLAAYAGLAVAFALPAVVRVSGRDASLIRILPSGVLEIVLTLSFFTITGLRAVFNFPAELRANWMFQMAEENGSVVHIGAVRKWIVAMGIVPLFVMLAPLEIALAGWSAAFVHLSFALLLALILLNILLVWFRKIPFTCSYFPGKTSMAAVFFLYLVGFTTYCWTMTDVLHSLMRNPAALIFFYGAAGAALWGLLRLQRREFGIDNALIYEDKPDPIVRTLEISS